MRINIYIIALTAALLASCSTTRNLPEGETLYTGIKQMTFVDAKEHAATPIGEEAMNEIAAALDCPPNASIAGSSKYRSLPVGLWVYNRFVDSKGKIGRWIFKTFATTPVLLSNVNPTLRAQVAANRLQNYGYFNGEVSEEIAYNKKNPKKAKVSYTITLGEPRTYDSIEYRHFSPRADSLIEATKRQRLLKSGEQFSVPNLTGERNRLNTLLRNNGYYYYQSGYIDYLADTINHPGHVSLHIEPHKGLPAYIREPKFMGKTTLKVTKSGSSMYGQKPDTTTFRNLTYIHHGEKAPVRAGTILRNVQLRPGQLYSQEKQSLTLQQLSQLNIFSSLNFTFTPRGEDIANDTLDINHVLETYAAALKHSRGETEHTPPTQSASDYVMQSEVERKFRGNDDVMVIDQNLKGIDFQMAKCCQPVYGDEVFGFVTNGNGIKIHRTDCPNAPQLRQRFGYRIVKARWAGKRGTQYPITLHVVGNDDLGIVNNITSIISKEEKILLRSISIDSYDGLFSGRLTVMLEDTSKLQNLIKKLKTIKGIKNVSRN